MITSHLPTIFGDTLKVYLSSVEDGSMIEQAAVSTFSALVNIPLDHIVYFRINYEGTNFCRYAIAKASDETSDADEPLYNDAYVTDDPGRALFLPLADCTAAVLFDPVHKAFMVSHLGRHSTEQYGARQSVIYMQKVYGSKAEDLLVWLTPSPNGEIYPLWNRDNMSLHEANYKDLLEAGVKPELIERSPVDTATDTRYFSHSEFLKGHRETDGRYGLLVQLAS